MQYSDLISAVTIAKLTEFLKKPEVMDILEIEDWGKMRAPEKRANFWEALNASVEVRKMFVDFYNASVSPDAAVDWIEGEKLLKAGNAEDAPAADHAETVAEPAVGDMPVPESNAPESKAPVLAGSPVFGHFVEGAFDQIVADAAGLNAEQSNQAVRAAEEDLEFQHLRLGVLLTHINAAQHYKTLGYDNLSAYLEAETGLRYRKAMNLIQNATVVRELGISASDLKGVTWAALRHVVPVLTKENYKVWLDAARSMKHISLIAAVREEQGKIKSLPSPESGASTEAPKDAQIVQKVFALYPDQKGNVEAALEKAKAEGQVMSQGAALDIIAAAYNATPPSPHTLHDATGLPDLSDEGLLAYFTKIRADEGDVGCARILQIIDKVWPHIDIAVDFSPEGAGQAVA